MPISKCCIQQFSILDKHITVYAPDSLSGAVIYLNTFEDEGEQVYRLLQDMKVLDFTLVTIDGLDWHHDMAPWDIPSIFEGDKPLTGGADNYIRLLSDEIVQKAEEMLNAKVLWRGLAGYSLAGLFAVYSLYKTDIFSRIASISGSFWFPGFDEYILNHELKSKLDCLYLSLGDRECKTANPYLRTVQKRTEEIRDFYIKKGIDTKFQLNRGGHMKNAVKRTVSGILSIISLQ